MTGWGKGLAGPLGQIAGEMGPGINGGVPHSNLRGRGRRHAGGLPPELGASPLLGFESLLTELPRPGKVPLSPSPSARGWLR